MVSNQDRRDHARSSSDEWTRVRNTTETQSPPSSRVIGPVPEDHSVDCTHKNRMLGIFARGCPRCDWITQWLKRGAPLSDLDG